MARSKRKSEIDEVDADFGPLLEHLGMERFMRLFVKEFGADKLIEQYGVEEFVAKLSPEMRKRLKDAAK